MEAKEQRASDSQEMKSSGSAAESKAGGGEDGDDPDEDLVIVELMSYLCSAGFQQDFEKFYAQHASGFQASESEEQSHENYTLFEEFQRMVESRIISFLESHGVSDTAFVSRSRKAMHAVQCESGESKVSDSDQAWGHVLSQVIAGTEYESFCGLMQEMYKVHAAGAAEAKGSHK
jgi:hypothetical protein